MKKKFKKGDFVVCTESDNSGFTAGAVYQVKNNQPDSVYTSKWCVSVELDDFGSKGNGWCQNFFKPAEKFIAGQKFDKKFKDFLESE